MFFTKNMFFFIENADFTYLTIYYNLIMQFMSCDTYAMLNIHVSKFIGYIYISFEFFKYFVYENNLPIL